MSEARLRRHSRSHGLSYREDFSSWPLPDLFEPVRPLGVCDIRRVSGRAAHWRTAEMPDADKSGRQDEGEKAAQELFSFRGHAFIFVSGLVIFPAQGHFTVL